MDKVRGLVELSHMKDQPKKESGITIGKLFHGLVGAGIGLGVAKAISSKFDIDPSYSSALNYVGAAAGAALNMGILKRSNMSELPSMEKLASALPVIEEQRRNAFQLGFIKAAIDVGYFTKSSAAVLPVPMIPITPSGLLSIPRGISGAIRRSGELVGNIAGAADAPDEDEVDIAKLEVAREMLRERLDSLLAERRNSALRGVLAKRRMAG
jgi:hypothetical protein